MQPGDFKQIVIDIRRKDPRYSEEAYAFVHQGVLFAAEHFNKPEFGSDRHLSGAELSEGLREFAISEFGPMSHFVMKKWGLNSTLDFGHVVFNLIDARVLAASPRDNLGDFHEVFDFEEAFIDPWSYDGDTLPEPERKIDE